MSDEWPKQWDEIRTPEPAPEFPNAVATDRYVDFGPIRTHKETVYINADGGEETDGNRDLWLPLGLYLERRSNGEIDQ